jgi:hypothetical protein
MEVTKNTFNVLLLIKVRYTFLTNLGFLHKFQEKYYNSASCSLGSKGQCAADRIWVAPVRRKYELLRSGSENFPEKSIPM